MSVGINGVSRLNANDYREINIKQMNTDDYRVDVIGDRIGKVNSDFYKNLKGMSNEDKIVTIIERYLDNFKIYGITTELIELSYKDGKWLVVYGNNSNRILRLQLFNSKFEEIFKIINDKYLNDRYDFFWNNDIKKMRLVLDTKKSSYNVYPIECDDCNDRVECLDNRDSNFICDTYVNCSVNTDKENGASNFEKVFLTEYLNYRFWQIGEEVKVKTNSIGNDNSLNKYISSHIIKCGDFELSFPHKEEIMFIFSIVNNYNNELFEIKNSEKKRQLKMEGF